MERVFLVLLLILFYFMSMNKKALNLVFDEKVLKKTKKDSNKEDFSLEDFMIKAL